MALKVICCLILCQGLCVVGTVIHPENPDISSTIQVHCLSSNKPIQIKDPFNHSLIKDTLFIIMEWYQLNNTGDEIKETLLLRFMQNETITVSPKFSVFEFWGLQINNADLGDSATYVARLLHLSQGLQWSVKIVVATPPTLKSERLSVSRSVNKDGNSVTLSCGQIASLGSPPVSFVWKTESGTILPAVYQDGNLQLTLTSQNDTKDHICDLDLGALAAKCILDENLPRFNFAATQSTKSESAGVTDIIAGVVIALAVVAVIIIIVVFVVRRRITKSVYNAKEHEKKRDDELGEANGGSPLEDKEKQHKDPHQPIYKGVGSSDSFVISNVSNENTDLTFQKLKPQVSSTKNMVYLNGEGSHPSGISDKHTVGKDKPIQMSDWKKGNQEMNDKGEGKEMKPPQTMPKRPQVVPRMKDINANGRIVGMDNGTSFRQGTLV